MSNIQLRKSERKQSKLRIGLSGPAGSGKTYSALLIASGIASKWDKICLIDSENGRGDFYSDLGDYNIISLKAPFTPESYIEAITAAEEAGMEVIIIDSISHEWEGSGGCLEINERLAAAKFKGNTWAAWSETTPRHQKFISAIISSKCDIVTTVRTKIEMVQEGKTIKKVGTKEITREGYEYELTVNFNIDRDGHYAIASKDNTRLFDSRDPFIITAETGNEINTWKGSGKKDYTQVKSTIAKHLKTIAEARLQAWPLALPAFKAQVRTMTGFDLTEENYETIAEILGPIASDWAANPLDPNAAPEPDTIPEEVPAAPATPSPDDQSTTEHQEPVIQMDAIPEAAPAQPVAAPAPAQQAAAVPESKTEPKPAAATTEPTTTPSAPAPAHPRPAGATQKKAVELTDEDIDPGYVELTDEDIAEMSPFTPK